MVMIQVDLPDKTSKKLDVYSAYTGKDKRDSIINIIDDVNLDDVREEYFESKKKVK